MGVYPLDFDNQGGLFLPRNPALHDMAVKFAAEHMGGVPNFVSYARCWVACECDEQYRPQEISGLSTMRMVPDIENMRFLNTRAAKRLIDRMHAFLGDQGVRSGSDVFVRIAQGNDPYRCPQYTEWLASERARPAERWVLPTR